MADEELKCTYRVKVFDGKDNQGRPTFHHEACGLPAAEVEVGGTLTSAKAVLCSRHKLQADQQSFTSKNGYPFGKIEKELAKEGYRQDRLPGTGVREK